LAITRLTREHVEAIREGNSRGGRFAFFILRRPQKAFGKLEALLYYWRYAFTEKVVDLFAEAIPCELVRRVKKKK